MYRLKYLHNNQHPEEIVNPTPKPLDLTTLIPAYPTHLSTSPKTYLSIQPSRITNFCVGAAIFYNNYLLLVQRAAHSSYPLHWELPGGGCEGSDASILEALKREVREDTGLLVEKVVGQILPAETFNTGWYRRMKVWLKVSFVIEVTEAVETTEVTKLVGLKNSQDDIDATGHIPENESVKAEEAEDAVNGTGEVAEIGRIVELKDGEDNEDDVMAISSMQDESVVKPGESDPPANGEGEILISKDEGKFALTDLGQQIVVRLAEEGVRGAPAIRLHAEEHQASLWVTEEEVRAREIKGIPLEFICDAQVQALLNAFKVRQQANLGGW